MVFAEKFSDLESSLNDEHYLVVGRIYEMITIPDPQVFYWQPELVFLIEILLTLKNVI